MTNPVISIIVPIYNVSKYLQRCLDSILGQTFFDYELLLVDDGSTDISGSICDDYGAIDSRIRVFHIPNGGAGAARKYGVAHACGRWILFVDGDDTIPTDSLQNLYAIAESEKYDIVVGTLNLNNRTYFKHNITGVVSREDYICALLLGNTSIGPVAKLYKAELYKSLEWNTPKEIKNNEDLLMLISLATRVKQVFIADQVVVYNYLYREGSASKSKPMPFEVWILLFTYIDSLLQKHMNNESIYIAFIKYEIRLLYLCNVLQGEFIKPDSFIFKKLQKEVPTVGLDDLIQNYWNILQSPLRQRMAYLKNVTIDTLKSIVKTIIGKNEK